MKIRNRKPKRKKREIILRKIIKTILRLRFFYFTKNVKNWENVNVNVNVKNVK